MSSPLVPGAELAHKAEKNDLKKGQNDALSDQELHTLLDSWNKQTNEGIHTGFLLAEHMYAEIGEDKRPPIIFYTNYDQMVTTICSETITADAFTLYDSVLNHLARDRWKSMHRYLPPWAKKQTNT